MVTFYRTTMVYLIGLDPHSGDHITPDIIFVIIEIDWDKTSLFDLKRRGVNQRHFEWWKWGTTSNPRYSSDLDDIALIQISLSTSTIQILSPILVNVWKVAVFFQSSFSTGCKGTRLMMDKWVDGVGLMQLRPISSSVISFCQCQNLFLLVGM